MESPAAAGPGSATSELFAHEWARGEDGVFTCTNPERITCDGMPAGTTFVALLGYSALYSQWFMTATVAPAEVDGLQLRSTCAATASRTAALLDAIELGACLLPKNKKAGKVLNAFRDRVVAGEAGSPANSAPPEPVTIPVPEPQEIALAPIDYNPLNPRKVFPEDYIAELADSLRRDGLLQRIGVKLLPAVAGEGELPGVAPAPRYRLLYGECRVRAARSLGWERIRAEVYPETLDARTERRFVIVENLKRRDLNPIEEAQGYAELIRDWNFSHEDVAREVKKSRPTISNALRLLELPADVQDMLANGELTTAHGVGLLKFKPEKKDAEKFPLWPKVVSELARLTVSQKLSASAFDDLEQLLSDPFVSDVLDNLGDDVAIVADTSDVGYKLPPGVDKHPAYFRSEDYGWICFNPAHWDEAIKAHRAAEAEKRKAEKAREERAATSAAAKPKSIGDLPKGSFSVLQEDQAELSLSLIPDEMVMRLPKWNGGADKVDVCARPAFAKKVEDAVKALRDEDRKAKLPPLIEKARKKILGIKKLGPAEQTLALGLVSADDNGNFRLTSEAAKRQGVKLTGKWGGSGTVIQHLDCITKIDPVDLFRVLLDNAFEEDLLDETAVRNGYPRVQLGEHAMPLDGMTAFFVRWLLDIETFGLLEETKAGQKQLVEAVKAQDWYKAELAKIELEAAKAKPPQPQHKGKKGGKS